jgi:uncharacterized protein YndB with AHSA1/START domain
MNLIELTAAQSIEASADQLFEIWSNPELPGGPWHGVKQVVFKPVVGELFYFAVEHEGKTWAHFGRILRVERPRFLEYTWMSEATHGQETTVAITFAADPAQAGRTLVTLRHSGVTDDEMGRGHQDGWNWVLSQLAASAGRGTP